MIVTRCISVCEIKLPLHDRDSTIFSLQMTTDTLLILTAETTPVKIPDGNRPPMQSGMPPGGGGDGYGRSMGPPPGGMTGGPEDGGLQGGNPFGHGGMMQTPEQVSLECHIVIAKEKFSGE